MATKLLKNSSFALVRTNPKLTTNVKLVVDSTDGLYLESFNANTELSKSKYKAFKVSEKSSYDYDLNRFYSKGKTPAELSFDVQRISSDVTIEDLYGKQFEFQYNYGACAINSKTYNEEFGILAPIWLERTIPEYFIVFRVDGPSNVTNLEGDDENLNSNIAKDPSKFKELILNNSTIIKTFDLTERSAAGKYIRKYRESERFPTTPLLFTTEREKATKWNGIDIKSGGFSSKDEFAYNRVFGTDSTIIEDDYYITAGFERNNIALANIINMEFLFDDNDADDFTINRYFGLFVNEVEEGSFKFSGRGFFKDRNEKQYPKPNNEYQISYDNTNEIDISNENGVKLYVEESSIKVKYVTGDIDNDIIPDIFPRDFLPTPTDAEELVSIFYVKDKENNFYNINTGGDWKEGEELRLAEKTIDISKFTGTGEQVLTTTGYVSDIEKGKASAFIEVNGNIPHGDRYLAGLIKKQTYEFTAENIVPGTTFKISDGTNIIAVNALNSNPDDLFDSLKAAWDNSAHVSFSRFHVSATNGKLVAVERDESGIDVDFTTSLAGWFFSNTVFNVEKKVSSDLQPYVITADTTLGINQGEAFQRFFNPVGTNAEIASAMAKAFNNLENRMFEATAVDNRVVLVSRLGGSRFNKISIGRGLFLSGVHSSIISNEPGITHPDFEVKHFEGGSETSANRIKVDIEKFNRFSEPNRYLQTVKKNASDSNIKPIKKVSYYVDEPVKNKRGEIIGYNDFDKYCTVIIDEGETIYRDIYKKIYLYKLSDIKFGRFSIFPIRDMDFDFYSQEYGDEKELNFEKQYYSQFGGPVFQLNHQDINDFYENKEFESLISVLEKEDSDKEILSPKIESEYERLNENYIKELTVPSRVVPTINKWVYRNGKNVRESDYRLSSSDAFGINNFSPSAEDFDREVESFTHEWYYLQEMPPYMGDYSNEELNKTFSYFPDAIDVEATGLLNLNEDYFTEYFTVDVLKKANNITFPWTGIPLVAGYNKIAIDKQLRYSIFDGGNNSDFSTAFHRGVKVIIKERSERNIPINFNMNSIKLKKSNRFNGYKFSCVLIPNSGEYGGKSRKRVEIEFIENRKFKNITLLIYADINDTLNEISEIFNQNTSTNTNGFIDRTILYALNSKYVTKVESNSAYGTFADVDLSGAIDITSSSGSDFSQGEIFGTTDNTGELTRFLSEILVNPEGGYGEIETTNGSTIRTFKVVNVLSDTELECTSFSGGQPYGLSQLQIENGEYKYLEGGYNHWVSLLNRLSFANIASLINNGSPEISYTTIDEDGSIIENAFVVELQTATRIVKPSYLKPFIDSNKPVNFNLSDISGYELDYQEKARIVPTYRHSGYFQPKFIDVIRFEDPYIIEEIPNSLEKRAQIRKFTRDSNTQIKLDADFSKIKNLFYHKVNDVNPNGILELGMNDAFKPLYPLIGEIAIDKLDFYGWLSNWDPCYFKKSVKKNITQDKIGTRSVVENKSFFSSKIMKISDELQVETFDPIEAFNDEELIIVGEDILKPNNTNEIAYCIKEGQIIMDVYLEKRLVEALANAGIRDFFKKYIKPEFGFGSEESLEDDIESYIRINILPRYKIGNIDLYVVKSSDENFNVNNPLVNSTLTDIQKISIDMTTAKEFNVNRLSSRSNFDTKVIYNTTKGFKYSIAPSFKIIKK
tara:strand:+ start:5730 stop:10724 length:4995 start_codon:yes stop_codon:yes gene_type:complete